MKSNKKMRPEYAYFACEFMASPIWHSTKKRAFIARAVVISFAIALPFITAFIVSWSDVGNDWFIERYLINLPVSIVICSPLSVFFIINSFPLYYKILRRTLDKYGFSDAVPV
jgi:uncharacterized BrkB/YihY/UPF0761 family membrane protein